jgi:hypothetical protein
VRNGAVHFAESREGATITVRANEEGDIEWPENAARYLSSCASEGEEEEEEEL